MKVIIERPKNIFENELLKDFQISKFEIFELTDGTVCYITDINDDLYYKFNRKYHIEKEHYFNYGSLHIS